MTSRQRARSRSRSRHRVRRHGCERPWAGAQVVAVLIALLSTAIFFAFSMYEIEAPHLRLVALIIVSAQLFLVVALFLSISFLDPAHPAVIRRRQERQRQQRQELQRRQHLHQQPHQQETQQPQPPPRKEQRAAPPAPSIDTSLRSSSSVRTRRRPSPSATPRRRLVCSLCDAVVSRGTRHCSFCRKCIADFDHHCVYLNTCIGSRNYALFIALLASSIVLMATQLTAHIYAIVRCRPRDQVRTIVVSVLTVLPALQLISMLVLAVFHANLYFRGLKTYEWLRRWQQTAGRSPAAPPPRKRSTQSTERDIVASTQGEAATATRSGGETTSDLDADSDNPDYGGRTPVSEAADSAESDDTRATDDLV
ncbi:hypothetical protein PINS_up007138 [Pythium insidiosum]|nr:hypothetical protein PINS_up007138 [Pythium insidiosum]